MLDIVESIVVMATIFIILYLIILKKKADINDYFYYNIRNVIKGADCWGWATWKRGWDLFCSDGKYLLKERLKIIRILQIRGR